ncbi:indole-3-glycerol phosphate synthase TrpC [Streptomyces coelicoflavus]|uniref:indole-3-glycerol phosphate synthase TrpC n=1 Tax=Streptomyces coelicoflavus TaxID=285562 RepID=UPI0002476702|nr:indole-3-glycerol phosphate synthase TrpC [Streptomyces coelicoflavus]EHN80155.1 indole-3-glycerol-phosphate synthase [Streptomyces coelicoflavus ZG0656]MZE46557.1 indole-3-glycerol phosphate synthase TrpC [Streptomyces sp. SID5477]
MSVLDGIVAGAREDLEARRAVVPEDRLWERAREYGQRAPAAAEVIDGLRGTDGLRVIAEIKRTSPARGPLADIADPAALAARYAAGGAAAISVLTEPRRFHGSLEDLETVRSEVRLPLLRKDFVVDAYQVVEARAHGADLVLLIVAALGRRELADLIALARKLGLVPLVEVHDEQEAARAVDAGAEVIGVNARDLRTLNVDPDTFARVADRIPAGLVRIAESGVRDPEDAARYARLGADAVLVGSSLVTGDDPAGAVAALVAAGRPA